MNTSARTHLRVYRCPLYPGLRHCTHPFGLPLHLLHPRIIDFPFAEVDDGVALAFALAVAFDFALAFALTEHGGASAFALALPLHFAAALLLAFPFALPLPDEMSIPMLPAAILTNASKSGSSCC